MGADFFFILLGAIIIAGFVLPLVLTARKARRVIREIAVTASEMSTPGQSPLAGLAASVSSDGDALASLPARFDPTAAAGLTAVLQLHFTDHQPSDWHLDIAQGTCQLVGGVAPAPHVTITTPIQVWSDIVDGKASADAAFLGGSLRAEGDTSLLLRFSQFFPAGPLTGSAPPPQSVAPVATAARITPEGSATGTANHAPSGKLSALAVAAAVSLAEEKFKPILETSGHLSPDEMRAVMIGVLTGRMGDEVIADHPGAQSPFLSPGHARHPVSMEAVQAALRQALESLPADATSVDKAKAIRAALEQAAGTT